MKDNNEFNKDCEKGIGSVNTGNDINLTNEEKAIIVDYIGLAVGEGYNGYSGAYRPKEGFNNEYIEEQLVVISYKLGFSERDIDISHIQINKNEIEKAKECSDLTNEEKAIIVNFVGYGVGEGYKGEPEYQDVEERLSTISHRLGFLRNDIGIVSAKCKQSFKKDNVIVEEGETCYYAENTYDVSIITKDKKYLELTYEEAVKYFFNVKARLNQNK